MKKGYKICTYIEPMDNFLIVVNYKDSNMVASYGYADCPLIDKSNKDYVGVWREKKRAIPSTTPEQRTKY